MSNSLYRIGNVDGDMEGYCQGHANILVVQINVDVLMETIDMIREAENDAYSRARATWIRENFGTFVREQYDQGHLPAEDRWAAYLDGPLDKCLLPAGEG